MEDGKALRAEMAFIIGRTYIRCAAAARSSVPRYTASSSYSYESPSGLQAIPRGGVSSAGGGPAAMPLLALAQDLLSVGTAALVGAALTIGERVFSLLGWESSIFGRKNAAQHDGSGDIFGSSGGTAAVAAAVPAVPKAAVGFAASSTLIGACLVLAAVQKCLFCWQLESEGSGKGCEYTSNDNCMYGCCSTGHIEGKCISPFINPAFTSFLGCMPGIFGV